MIKVENIDVDFKQHGNICMFASYSLIIDYYSDKNISYKEIFSSVIGLFPGLDAKIKKALPKTLAPQRRKMREDLISDEYHEYCRNNGDIRGFDYITNLHITNALGTQNYCKVLKNNAIKNGFISQIEKLDLRDNLKIIGGLAMVLFPTNPNWHAIVVGYDTDKTSYFQRDPNFKRIDYVDFLLSNDICEYIWLSDK